MDYPANDKCFFPQTNTTEKPSMVLQLMGGHVEAMESSGVGVDDGVSRSRKLTPAVSGGSHSSLSFVRQSARCRLSV